MKKANLLITLLMLFSTSFVCSDERQAPMHAPIKDPKALLSTEISRLDTLIQATDQSLQGQRLLKSKIIEYKDIQDEYLLKTEDNDLLLKMVKCAHKTLQMIKENHLEQTFDPEFIEELTVLSQAASKKGVPRP